jgi:hypothetical protein
MSIGQAACRGRSLEGFANLAESRIIRRILYEVHYSTHPAQALLKLNVRPPHQIKKARGKLTENPLTLKGARAALPKLEDRLPDSPRQV